MYLKIVSKSFLWFKNHLDLKTISIISFLDLKIISQIPKSLIGSSMRRVYSAYPGVGSVFAMVATYKNQSAAYVPSFTYACSDSLDECGSMLGKYYLA